MSAIGYLESLLNPLPADIRKVMVAYTREGFKRIAFGAPSTTSSSGAATNLDGHLVAVTTSSTANAEVAVQHGLNRVPRLLIPVLDPNTANATLPETLTISRAADATYLYLKSPTQSASCHVYVE